MTEFKTTIKTHEHPDPEWFKECMRFWMRQIDAFGKMLTNPLLYVEDEEGEDD